MVIILPTRNCMVYSGSNSRSNNIMISKEDYIEQQVESSWEDYKFISQILYEYFEEQVKDMSQEEFKQHLKDLNWTVE